MLALLVSWLLALPFTTPKYEVTVERNVPYATVQGYYSHTPVGDRKAILKLLFHSGSMNPITLEMDIYLPEGDLRETRPLLLMMHGGAFFIGNKEELGQAAWCRYFASLGYVAASINYRLGFHPVKEEVREAEMRALEDADAALAYLLGREDLRINPQLVFLAGTSAGAITALNMAYRPAPVSTYRICAVANLWGAVHSLSVLERASVPILSFQSVEDPILPYEEGYPLNNRLKHFSDYFYGTHAIHEKAVFLGIPAEHHPCLEPRHALHLDENFSFTPRFAEIRDAMAAFFATFLQD
jgi:dienelactone hydrolase